MTVAASRLGDYMILLSSFEMLRYDAIAERTSAERFLFCESASAE